MINGFQWNFFPSSSLTYMISAVSKEIHWKTCANKSRKVKSIYTNKWNLKSLVLTLTPKKKKWKEWIEYEEFALNVGNPGFWEGSQKANVGGKSLLQSLLIINVTIN